jgi:ubiquinone/menaquinone biosynthesis C-methylase UbiE
MQQPERVIAEIYRVLKPGGVCIITFSNRMFYSKAGAARKQKSTFQISRDQIRAHTSDCHRGQSGLHIFALL